MIIDLGISFSYNYNSIIIFISVYMNKYQEQGLELYVIC